MVSTWDKNCKAQKRPPKMCTATGGTTLSSMFNSGRALRNTFKASRSLSYLEVSLEEVEENWYISRLLSHSSDTFSAHERHVECPSADNLQVRLADHQ